jgi:quercetin dioxygenase-like cupin family protein
LSQVDGKVDWDNVPEEAMDSEGGAVLRRFIHGANTTVARVSFEAGAAIAVHSHPNEQWAQVLTGRMEFTVDGKSITVEAGQMLHLLPDVPHGAKALVPSVVLDMFAPPRLDWG